MSEDVAALRAYLDGLMLEAHAQRGREYGDMHDIALVLSDFFAARERLAEVASAARAVRSVPPPSRAMPYHDQPAGPAMRTNDALNEALARRGD